MNRWGYWGQRLALIVAIITANTYVNSARAAEPVVIFEEGFEAYSSVATNLTDVADADPTHPDMMITDDNPVDGAEGSGIQVGNWQAHSGTNSLVVRAGSEAQVHFKNARSGSRYQLDFWLYVAKGEGNRSFNFVLRGEGSDNNGDDFLAYRSDRAATPGIWYYDGVGPDAAAWVDTGATHTDLVWQHHRLVIDPTALKFDAYLDDMNTPVVAGGELSRPDAGVPTVLRILNEGDSADDGYFLLDDLSLTVEGAVDLATTFTDGFEAYPARANAEDDANPAGPWVTTELLGTGSGKERAPYKVQVVGTDVVPPHSGAKCLKLEGGQRAGVSLAWGVPAQADVQITWWARVPASVAGSTANYLRMSLYGAENGNALGGDNALLGYGSRQSGVGDETSLTYYVTSWLDSGVDYTPDTWEEYRLITHTSQGRYTILKNPSGANPEVIVDRAPFIGSATNWTPVFMAAWSSSNGSDHPPVYIDDIECKTLVSNPDPLPEPYTANIVGSRFTNVTTLALSGPIGGVAVDPRDNSTIVFAVDAASGGSLQRATKTASGEWTVDATPVVSGLSNPSGVVIGNDGTLWWTHDYTAALMRLRAPWAENTPEQLIADFGPLVETAIDDDPIDLTLAPTSFNGALGKPGMVIVADRGSDGDAYNALYYVDPATTELKQTGYDKFLVGPTPGDLGSGNLNAIAALSAYGEVLTLSQDGYLTAINGDGAMRSIWPATLWSDLNGPTPAGSALAVDPQTGRIWVADDVLNELWSISAAPGDTAQDQKEIAFPLTNESRPEGQIDFNDPGMAFAPNGAFLVVSDASTVNGGGRLLIFHNDAAAPVSFRVSQIAVAGSSVHLEWEAVAGAKYRVQRAASLGAAFEDVSGELAEAAFTDASAPAGGAFYRVIAVR